MPHVSNYNFSKDIVIGKEAEYEFSAMLKPFFPNNYVVDGNEKRWDIIVPAEDAQKHYNDPTAKQISFEIKNDKRSASTGNLAIEYADQRGLTGISVSEADFYVIKSLNTFYVAERTALYKYTFDPLNKFKDVEGGDRDSTKMILVPLKSISQQAFFQPFTKPMTKTG